MSKRLVKKSYRNNLFTYFGFLGLVLLNSATAFGAKCGSGSMPDHAVCGSGGNMWYCDTGYAGVMVGTTPSCIPTPSNSKSNTPMSGFTCNTGYVQKDNTCILPVSTPTPTAAATTAASGANTCGSGFYKNGSSCVKLPENATASGTNGCLKTGYCCNAGYFSDLIHQSCPKVPDNSVINNTGDGYNCNLKFYKDLTKNLCVSPPQNASVNATGDGYKCNANFYLSGSTCIKKPDHSSVSPSGTDYVCDENFIRGITATTLYQCVPGCSDPKKVLYSGKCYLSPGEGGNLNTSTGVVDCKAGYYASAGVSGQKIDATPALQCALLPARGVANIGTSGFHCETNFIVSGGSCAALKCPATIPGSSGPANFNGYKPTYIVSDGKCILDPKNYPPSTWYLPAQATDAKGTYVLYCGTAVDSRYGTGVWALNSTQGFFLSNSGNDFKDIHTGPACCGGTANGETMSRTKCSPSGNYPVLPTQLYLSVPAVQ